MFRNGRGGRGVVKPVLSPNVICHDVRNQSPYCPFAMCQSKRKKLVSRLLWVCYIYPAHSDGAHMHVIVFLQHEDFFLGKFSCRDFSALEK